MVAARDYEETIVLPRAVRFPVELVPPDGFDAERLETWPKIAGRLEFVDGRLLYLPPCGDVQQDCVADVVITLGGWVRSHPSFVLGTNEAGMRLRGYTRASDAALWRRSDAGPRTGGLRRQPPVLAVEVAGMDDPEEMLRTKAAWYLESGVAVVWLVLPDTREVVVLTAGADARYALGQRIPLHAELPGLSPDVKDFFVQLESR